MEGGWEKECPPQKTCWWSIQFLASSLCENHRRVRPGIVRIVTHAYQPKQKFWISIAPNCVTKNTFYVTKDTVLPSVLVTFLTESSLVEEWVYLVDTCRSLRNSRQVFCGRAAHNFMECYLWQGNSLKVYEVQHGEHWFALWPPQRFILNWLLTRTSVTCKGSGAAHSGLLLPYQ